VRDSGATAEASQVAAKADFDRQRAGLLRLVDAIKELSLARSMNDICAIVRRAARALNGADGATFVLMEGDMCHYADEDAIAPLWKGLRFPISTCISGWVMEHRRPVVIEDIYQDARVPADAYRPTFVKSLVMVPVRSEAPVAAIGNYWATPHVATPDEVSLIQALADSTSVAMENVRVHQELEQRVRARTAELETTNLELEAFSDSVSHDLRNPLSQVIGFTELLSEELIELRVASPSVQSHIAHILKAGHKMTRLIDDLLQLGHARGGPLRNEPVDLGAMAREWATGFTQDPAGGGAATPIDWRVADGLVAAGDPNLLRVVMQNLLANAVKYSGKRAQPVIEVGSSGVDVRTGQPIFHVRDNGAGFDPQQAQRLFTPFERLHSAHEFPGTGIGLATCRRIIERHQGHIWAEAAPDAGATFYFSLPAA
jgi:signal transduction histidine kinase